VLVLAPALAGVVAAMSVSGSDERVVQVEAPMWVAVATGGLLATFVCALVAVSWWVYRGADRAVSVRPSSSQVARARRQWLMESRAEHAAFLSRLDRELKGPSMAIRLSMAALSDKSRPVLVATEQSGRITQLVTDLGVLAEAETAELDAGPVPLVTVVEQVVADLRRDPALCSRDISVQPPAGADKLVVSGAADQLSLVVRHLLVNALRFSPADASVTVRLVVGGATAVLEVTDTGRGIPPDEVDLVWQTLARGSNVTDVPGSGLGLALVRAIVERHGGVVDLSSRLGEGTSVHVRLPLDPGAQRGFGRRQPTRQRKVASPQAVGV